jgi:mono/diheme cytochrome c family protein
VSSRSSEWLGFLSIVVACLLSGAAHSQQRSTNIVKRGEYIFALAGGCACHTVPDETPHAGGRPFPIPLGEVSSTNITQDKETGIGKWSDKEIRDALVRGIRPNGDRLLPVMPYEAYSGMAEEDLKALIAYLKTLKPVHKEYRSPKIKIPFLRPVGTPIWLRISGRAQTPPAQAPKRGMERGRYLLEHVSLCGDCHTPRNFLGMPDHSLYLAGTKQGPLGVEVANITPDKKTGIGKWTRNDIAHFLQTGVKPDKGEAEELMAEVLKGGFKKMNREDALAIADYLKSVQPIVHKIK